MSCPLGGQTSLRLRKVTNAPSHTWPTPNSPGHSQTTPSLAPATPGQQGLTQQEPQEPWSLISLMVGHCGHCSRASKLSGRAISPASESLDKERSPLKAYTLPSVLPTPSRPYQGQLTVDCHLERERGPRHTDEGCPLGILIFF